jgi:NAD(P)-dependent dehydrogenase (short-subunit alcohol dehydrogenase family)
MAGVALVTGAARGIGAATVARLADAGWRVVAVDRCRVDPRLPYALGTDDQLAEVVARANTGAEPDGAVAVVGNAASVGDVGPGRAAEDKDFDFIAGSRDNPSNASATDPHRAWPRATSQRLG